MQHAGHLELDQDDRNPFDFKKSSNQAKVVRRWSVVGGVWCVVSGMVGGGGGGGGERWLVSTSAR